MARRKPRDLSIFDAVVQILNSTLGGDEEEEEDMIGRVGGARDSSFLCLLAIYAAHVLLFHVLDVSTSGQIVGQPRYDAPSLPLHRGNESRMLTGNGTEERRWQESGVQDLLSGELRREVFARSSQLRWESPIDHPMNGCTKISLDLASLLAWIHRVKNMFASVALSSSTWGIISGCAIFLLTYTDRDNTLPT